MKIVFFGTPEYVVQILNTLHKKYVTGPGISPIVAVVTQKPAPIGRNQKLSYSPVDAWAFKHKIDIYYGGEELLASKVKADLGVLAGYGEILPEEVIKLFPQGILNIHTSLLPKWRGASPEQAAILAGDTISGGSIMKLDSQMDHGPILTQFEIEIAPDDTRETLRNKIFEKGAIVLADLIDPYVTGKIKLKTQNHSETTYTRLIKKDYGFIPPEAISNALKGKEFAHKFEVPFIKDFSIDLNPVTIERFIRAMNPWPGVWSTIKLVSTPEQVSGNKRIKILKAHLETSENDKNKSNLLLDEVQLEGKNPVSYEEFKRGYPTATFD